MDKQADIIIADHARKDSPAGSFSWTYIDESVKKGRLEDIENHRAGPVERQIREVGSAQPSRTGRTPFTPEDDRVLMDWCDRAERRGIPMGGNEIFKQLEQKVCIVGYLLVTHTDFPPESSPYIPVVEGPVETLCIEKTET